MEEEPIPPILPALEEVELSQDDQDQRSCKQ